MGMVSVVLVDPPPIAQSVQQVGVQQAEQRRRHTLAGCLVVADVVSEELICADTIASATASSINHQESRSSVIAAATPPRAIRLAISRTV